MQSNQLFILPAGTLQVHQVHEVHQVHQVHWVRQVHQVCQVKPLVSVSLQVAVVNREETLDEEISVILLQIEY